MPSTERNCGGCRYWSQMIALSIGGEAVEAHCLAPDGPCGGKYMVATQTCAAFAYNTAGAFDGPPDCGEAARAEYGRQATLKHGNGAPKYSPDGTLLDDEGRRSVFDDVAD